MARVLKKCECDEESWTKCPHSWVVRYRTPGGRSGKQTERSFKLKRSADKFANQVETAKDNGTYIDPRVRSKPLLEVWDEWTSLGERVGNTTMNYRTMRNTVIEPFFKKGTIGGAEQKDVLAWMDWQREAKKADGSRKYAESTIINRFGCLSSMFNFAVINKYRSDNPCHGVKVNRKKVQRRAKQKIIIPLIEEIRSIASAARPPYRAAVWVMAGCGLRIGEVCALTREQIDFREGAIWVNRQATLDGENEETGGKRSLCIRHLKWKDADEGRSTPMPDFVATELHRHVRKYGMIRLEDGPNRMSGNYVFGNVSRQNICAPHWFREYIWHPATQAAGVRSDMTPHWLRHFFASACLAGGIPVSELAAWMGHEDPTVTYERYGHLMPDAPTRFRAVMTSALQERLTQQPESGSADLVLTLPLPDGVCTAHRVFLCDACSISHDA